MTFDIHTIFAKTGEIARLGSVDEVIKGLSRLLKRTVNSRWVAVYLLDDDHQNFLPARISGIPHSQLPFFSNMALNPGEIPLLKKLIRNKQHITLTEEHLRAVGLHREVAQ